MTEESIDRELDEEAEKEEVTEVTRLLDEVDRAVTKSVEIAGEACETARAVQRSLTPPDMPAVHVHVAECWERPGELSSRCPEKEKPTKKT